MRVAIRAEWCKGCYLCVGVCAREVLQIDRQTWTGGHHPVRVVHVERCDGCRNCELLCPDLAIQVLEAEDEEQP